MDNRKKPSVFVIILIVLASIAVLLFLVGWTEKIKSNKRQAELKKALADVIEHSGEKGLLEMAGIPVDDIYYKEDEITLFEGDNKAWEYTADELQNISVYKKAGMCVVSISTTADSSVSDFLDTVPENGVGSGFFVSSDGYICTNLHVVDNASFIKVVTIDEMEYDAEIVGVDEENDIAVIKILAEKNESFDYLTFADSDKLVVGQRVLALGSPFGYSITMTSGIISGLSRPIRNDKGQILLGMIQTDAQINPGNSGGPLLNTRGEVVGVNSSIYSTSGTNQGMNFAVASNTASASVSDIIKFGKVNRGWIDIVPVQLTSQIVEYANLGVSKGILVSQVPPNGNAAKSGIKGGEKQVYYGSSLIYLGGDIITSINGYEVSDISDMFTSMSNTRPGDTVDVVVFRDNSYKTIEVTLVERTSENIGWINR